MISSITTLTELRQRIQQLAHQLADGHAALSPQQQTTHAGQTFLTAKNLAYGLLRDMEQNELDVMFRRSDCLTQIKAMFPGRFCRIRTSLEFWPREPSETVGFVEIKVGFPKAVAEFTDETLSGAMARLREWYGDRPLSEEGQNAGAVNDSHEQ
jgi:hypothetical protein